MTPDLWFLLLSGVWTGVAVFTAYWTGVAVGGALARRDDGAPARERLERLEHRANRQRARQLAAAGVGARHLSGARRRS